MMDTVLGVQEFRSSGDQDFRRSEKQDINISGVQQLQKTLKRAEVKKISTLGYQVFRSY